MKSVLQINNHRRIRYMKKNVRIILKAMLSVFVIVLLLPITGKTVEAVEKSDTISLASSTTFGQFFKVEGDYRGGEYQAMFMDSDHPMTISAIEVGKEYKAITKVKLEYSASGTFDTTTLSTDPISTTEDHTTFTITGDFVYSVSFSSSAQTDPVRVTSVTVYYDDGAPEVPVSAISLNPDSSQTINIGGKLSFTAKIEPDNATDKTVKWNVNNDNVVLYTDQTYNTPVGDDATSILTVYATGVSAGSSTVTVTSNNNEELSASCEVIVSSEKDFITVEPQDALVSYPDGATFTVGVADESLVQSYQWYMLDQKGNLFMLEGDTADTNKLVVASSVQRSQKLRFFCKITDTQGHTHTTRQAFLDFENRYTEDKPVFYVGEYAIEPGESINLAEIDHGDGHPLGKGTITFDENGHDVILNNVYFDNDHTTASYIIGGNVGLDWEWHLPPADTELNLMLVGENRIVDHFAQPEYNLAGIPMFFCFWGQENLYRPMVNIKGDGSLTVVNGTIAISVLAPLTIDADVNVDQDRPMYSDGISAYSIDIKPGHTFNWRVNGTILDALGEMHIGTKGDITIEDAKITAYALMPHVSAGASTKHGIEAHNDLTINNSTIDLTIEVDQKQATEVAGCEFIRGNKVDITNSSIKERLVYHSEDKPRFAHHMIGLWGNELTIDNSNIDMVLNSPIVYQLAGVKGLEISIINNSKVDVDIQTLDGSLAVYSQGNLKIENSDVNATAKNLKENKVTPFAISAARIDIDLGENNYVIANAQNIEGGDQVAIAGMHGPYYVFNDETGSLSSSGNIILADDTAVVWPLNSIIDDAQTSVDEEGKIKVKTVVDKSTNKIAPRVEIAANKTGDRYSLIEGKGLSWGEDRNSYLQLRINRSVLDEKISEHFTGIEIDDKPVSAEFYFLKMGSLIVQIKPVFLKQLSLGQHTVSVVFDDGRVDTYFNVVKQDVPPRYVPPITGINKTVIV